MGDREAKLLCMAVMAEDTLWWDGPEMEKHWATVGFAAEAP